MSTRSPLGLGRLLGALAAGLLLAVCGAPRELPAILFLSPALLLLLLDPGNRRPRAGHGFALGWAMGFATNAFALSWVVGLLEVFAQMPLFAALPIAALLWLAQGLPFAFAGAGAAGLGARGFPVWVTLPMCLSVALTVTPALFPWRPSIGALPWLEWVQLAEIGGEPLLDLLWAFAGTGLAEAARRRTPLRRLLPAAVGALAVLLPALYGTLRLPAVMAQREAAPTLRVGVVQPNVGIFEKHQPGAAYRHLDELRTMTRTLEEKGAALTVWPESAYPFPIHRRARRDFSGPRGALRDGVGGPLLTGAITQLSHCKRWNSVVAIDRQGRIVGVSDKVRLLAFGEFVPLWHFLPPLQERFACPGLVPGTRPQVLSLAGAQLGVLNCYEDTLAGMTRSVMSDEPALLINTTNDAWFGDTDEPHLHHLVARMRSVETRRDLIRAVNTGVSGHVAATGENLVTTATWTEASFIAEAKLLEGKTFWVRFGDLTTPGLLGALLVLLLLGARRETPRGRLSGVDERAGADRAA